jgi:hypothetical protein
MKEVLISSIMRKVKKIKDDRQFNDAELAKALQLDSILDIYNMKVDELITFKNLLDWDYDLDSTDD